MAELSDDKVPLVVQALDYYSAYLTATNRDGSPYKGIADELRRKGPAKEDGSEKPRKKRA